MDPVSILLDTILIPAFASGIIMALALLVTRGAAGRLSHAAQCLGIGVGFFAGASRALGRVPLPPTDFQGRIVAVGIATALSLAALASLPERARKWLVLVTLPLIALGAVYVRGFSQAPSTKAFFALGVVVAGAILAIAATRPTTSATAEQPAPTRLEAALPIAIFLLSATGASVTCAVAGAASLGQMLGVACSSAGPALVLGLVRPAWGFSPVAASAAATIAAVVTASSAAFSNMTLASALCLLAAPLPAAIATRLQLKPLVRAAVQFVPLLLLAGISIAIAAKNSPAADW